MKTASSANTYTFYLPYLIALMTLAVFSPVLWHEFVNFDDAHVVYANNMIHSGITFDSVSQAFTSFYASSWVPLTWISLMVDVRLFGSGPTGHHLVNLLLHTGSSVLLFLIFNRATKAPLKSAAVAFLFALHPMHVQSVAWAAERKDVLSTFFGLSSVYVYLLYCEQRCAVRYLATFGLLALGLLSKPMIVTFPVLLLVLDWWPLQRITFDPATPQAFVKQAIKLCAEKIPFLAVSAGVSVVTYLAQKVTGGLVTEHSFAERFFRAGISYVAYIYKLFWPVKLAVFYPFVDAYPDAWTILWAFSLLALITVAAVRMRQSSPYLLAGWLWCLVTLLPVIGLIQVGDHSIADHYSYISFVGLFVMLVWGGAQIAITRGVRREVLWAISVLIFGSMVALTSKQIRYWKNTVTLLTHAIEVTDGNWLALNNLGQEYLAMNRVNDAIWCFNEAVKAKPSFTLALVNLGALYALRGEYASAREMLSRALMFEPGNEKARYLLGTLPLT